MNVTDFAQLLVTQETSTQIAPQCTSLSRQLGHVSWDTASLPDLRVEALLTWRPGDTV